MSEAYNQFIALFMNNPSQAITKINNFKAYQEFYSYHKNMINNNIPKGMKHSTKV